MSNVRIGFVGAGGFARYRIGNMLKVSDAKVVAMVDPSANQIDQTRNSYPQLAEVPAYSTTEAMYDDVKLDAVVIQTPHAFHAPQILEAFSHKCHVCCEKPLVATVEEAHQVIAARDKAKKVGMVSYQRHTQGEFLLIRELIGSGKYGAVQMVHALLSQEWKRLTANTWRQKKELSCGGQLNDSGSHMLDILLWVTGLAPKRVSALTDHRGTEVDINSTLNIQFEGGALGSVCILGDGANWHEDLTIACDRATFYVRGGELTIVEENGTKLRVENPPGMGTPDQHFVDAILGRVPLIATFEDALKVARLTQAAWASDEKGGAPVDA